MNGKLGGTNDGSGGKTGPKGVNSNGGNGANRRVPQHANTPSGSMDKPSGKTGKIVQKVHQAGVGQGNGQRRPSTGSRDANGSNAHGSGTPSSRAGGDLIRQIQGIRTALAGIKANNQGTVSGSGQAQAQTPKPQPQGQSQGWVRKETQGSTSGGNAFGELTTYVDQNGKEAHHVNVTMKEFNQRAQRIAHPAFVASAVGMKDSPVYRGSDNIRMDTMRNGNHAVRLAGHSLLGTVGYGDMGNAIVGPGCAVYSKPLSPEWLGGGIAAESRLYTQTKIHKFKLVFKSYMDPLSGGGIALTYNADDDRPCPTPGIAALQSASEGVYIEGRAVDSFSLDINPIDMNVTYDTDGGSNDAIQGLIRVLATSIYPIATVTMGNLYMEYDVEFFGPILDSLTLTPYSGKGVLDGNAYVVTAGNNLRFLSSSVTTAGSACCLWTSYGGGYPPQDGLIYSARVVNITGGAVNAVAQNTGPRAIVVGDTLFLRTEAIGAPDWTNRSVSVLVFSTLKSAQGYVTNQIAAGVISDGQFAYLATLGATTFTISFVWEAITV